jgi:hypothetical protein
VDELVRPGSVTGWPGSRAVPWHAVTVQLELTSEVRNYKLKYGPCTARASRGAAQAASLRSLALILIQFRSPSLSDSVLGTELGKPEVPDSRLQTPDHAGPAECLLTSTPEIQHGN